MMSKQILMAVLAAMMASAQAAGQAEIRKPQCADPCVPQRLRQMPAASAPASGEALQQQALGKLRRRFNEADLDGNGAVTQDEARQAGFGYLADHFAEIDTARAGQVTFDDLRRHMARRRRQALGQPYQ
jgi:hypothetical protein